MTIHLMDFFILNNQFISIYFFIKYFVIKYFIHFIIIKYFIHFIIKYFLKIIENNFGLFSLSEWNYFSILEYNH